MTVINATSFSITGYRPLQMIGSGGFGTVYRALHIASGETVAIKVGQTQQTPQANARLRETFDNEWAALNRLKSDRVVRPLDRGTTEDDRPYLILEHVPGVNLGEYLTSVEMDVIPFDLRQTAHLMLGAAEAVGVLHENGLIHNDLKPWNFIVTAAGLVTLCDLGMAIGVEEARKTGSRDHRGTPGFYGAETAETKRKDVFGLGSAFYCLLTGRFPFPREREDDNPFLLLARQQQPPRPRDVRPERKIPASLDRLVMKAIRRAPADRPSDALELAEKLRAIAARL